MTGVSFDAQTQIETSKEERLAIVHQAWSALKAA
jgi:hypothetical protein